MDSAAAMLPPGSEWAGDILMKEVLKGPARPGWISPLTTWPGRRRVGVIAHHPRALRDVAAVAVAVDSHLGHASAGTLRLGDTFPSASSTRDGKRNF